MFCPNCGTQVTESLKFCKQCGANLFGVRDAMTRGGSNFDWGKTWVAEMLLSEDERERKRGVTLEEKRYNEIKGGIITAVAGVGATLFFLYSCPQSRRMHRMMLTFSCGSGSLGLCRS